MRKITEKQLEESVAELLEFLPERSREILVKRFGLKTGKTNTLAAIGKEYGVSRERVRQIENSSFAFLKKAKKSKQLNDVIVLIYNTLQREGGFLDRKTLKVKVFGSKIKLIQKNQLAFLLNSLSKLHYQKDTIRFSGVWYLMPKKGEVKRLGGLHEKIVKHFKDSGTVMSIKELMLLTQTDIFNQRDKQFFQGELGVGKLRVILEASKLIGENIMKEWGLLSWGIISQKYVKEKAFLILKKYGEPLHFRELTKYMNEHWQDKKTLPQTVHNVIIKYEEFVFVKPGTYTLGKKYPEVDLKK